MIELTIDTKFRPWKTLVGGRFVDGFRADITFRMSTDRKDSKVVGHSEYMLFEKPTLAEVVHCAADYVEKLMTKLKDGYKLPEKPEEIKKPKGKRKSKAN